MFMRSKCLLSYLDAYILASFKVTSMTASAKSDAMVEANNEKKKYRMTIYIHLSLAPFAAVALFFDCIMFIGSL